jgi:protease-4
MMSVTGRRRVAAAIVAATAWVVGTCDPPRCGRSFAAEPVTATPAKPATPPSKPSAAVVATIGIDGALPEGVGPSGVFADVSPRLHRLIERLDKAADDSRVAAVLVSIGSPDVGRARADELRAAIERLKAKGKPVAAHLRDANAVRYAVACAADTVTLAPAATLELTGVRAEVTFFKEMLDKLGVEAEILQVGSFKGAAEPLTRSSMSPQLREQYEAFVGDLFEQLVERVSEDRSIPQAKVRELIDRGVFTAEAAREAGLVDAVGYEDEAIEALAKKIAAADGEPVRPKVVRDYGKQSIDDDFSGIGGLVKLMELLGGSKQGRAGSSGKKVAVIHLNGAIREESGSELMPSGGSQPVIKALREADKDDKVVAIVLRIDSPGGSALVSDLIWREAKRTAKPVVASLSDTAASGGYYAAVAADRIVAAPGTLTGSIGVVGGKVAVGGALERVGIRTDVVSKGRNAGWLSMQSPFRDHEREAFLGTMQDVYRLFTTKVAEGRRLDPAKMPSLAEGRVYTGRMAREVGLVDRLGTLEDAIDEARELAGLGKDERIERQLLPEPRGLFEDLFGMTGSVEPLAALARVDPRLVEAILPHAEAIRLLASGRPLALLPAHVRVE